MIHDVVFHQTAEFVDRILWGDNQVEATDKLFCITLFFTFSLMKSHLICVVFPQVVGDECEIKSCGVFSSILYSSTVQNPNKTPSHPQNASEIKVLLVQAVSSTVFLFL